MLKKKKFKADLWKIPKVYDLPAIQVNDSFGNMDIDMVDHYIRKLSNKVQLSNHLTTLRERKDGVTKAGRRRIKEKKALRRKQRGDK